MIKKGIDRYDILMGGRTSAAFFIGYYACHAMKIRTLLFSLISFALVGCAPASLQGSFVIVEETRHYTMPFHAVVLQDVGELTIMTEGEAGTLILKGDDNLVEAFQVTILDGVMTLDYASAAPVVPSRPFEITLVVDTIEAITLDHADGFIDLTSEMSVDVLTVTLYGNGFINLENVHADVLNVAIHGDGTLFARGEAREQRVVMDEGLGVYAADELRSEHAAVDLSGGVNARVWVTQILEPELSGGAKLFYYGSPQVRAEDDPIGLVDMDKK
jgi:hypothetical protein